jgi:5'-deoxynucleotidase YfbR-like HD superfamily hydrolase
LSQKEERSPFGENVLAPLVPLFREIVNLKRVRPARTAPHSLAERLFLRSWAALAEGEGAEAVMRREGAGALVATRLAGIDAGAMKEHDLPPDRQRDVLSRAFEVAAAPVEDDLADRLEDALLERPGDAPENNERESDAPAPARALLDQPRAGVTCPGKERLVLAPPESHADHCAAVAVMAALLAPAAGADPAEALFTGLVHHLHNATLPDAGHAGDVLLGDAKDTLTGAARERALKALPPPLAGRAEAALAPVDRPPEGERATPLARAFHAADALDRVLEIAWHARTADFTMAEALGEMNLIHEGPEQAFQQAVLADADVAGW